jgi:16S rRNA (cytosine967-C5)-methyltransferase
VSPEALVVRAAGPGRVRGIGVALWEAVLAEPARAGATLRRGLRAARALHSGERRLVQDALYGLIRRRDALVAVLGTDEPLVLWLGWLVLERGLSAATAAEARPDLPWDGLTAAWAAQGEGMPLVPRLALRHSAPEALVRRTVAILGDEAEAFWVASDERAPVTLRANRRRCTAAELSARLAGEGVETAPVDGLPDALTVVGRANVEGTRAFAAGWFEVQDAGSQRVAALVGGGPVIDACAGAGGKALALAARGLEVLALDVRARALDELGRRAKRAGVRVGRRVVGEDRWPDDLPRAPWVLVDAPCTGTGVLRRHPEHRWQVDDAAVATRAGVQGALLRRAAGQVLPGGHLVYATCSVLRQEDEDVVEAFLGEQPGWEMTRALRTWPQRDGCDGFFAAVLERGAAAG